MALLEDNVGDSSTSTFGRKRNLEETQDEDLTSSSNSPTKYRAQKRVKEDEEALRMTAVENGIIIKSTSPSRLQSDTQSIAPDPPAPPAMTWNKGVQSGLRLTFGGRTQSQLQTLSSSVQDEEVESSLSDTADSADLRLWQTSTPPGREQRGRVASSGIMDLQHLHTSSLPSQDDQAPSNIISVGMDLQPGDDAERPRSAASSSSGSDGDDLDTGTTPISHSDTTSTMPFKKLNKKQMDLLTSEERKSYAVTKLTNRREKKHKKFEAFTAEAEEVLEHEMTPLATKFSSVASNLALGKTFFPREVAEKSRVYLKRNEKLFLSEVLTDNKPIRIQNFSFNIFAPAFLRSNPDNWSRITQKDLAAAFNVYLSLFYSHVASFAGDARGTAHSANAITIEEALRDAKAVPTDKDGGSRGESTGDRGSATWNHLRASGQTTDDSPLLSGNSTGVSGNDGADGSGIVIAEAVVPMSKSVGKDISVRDRSQEMDIVIDRRELEIQQRYFPMTRGDAAKYHCLACADTGHKTLDCPCLTCTLCGGSHTNLTCPQNQRCNKCRQRGHQTNECPEKLLATKAEAVGCDFCTSKDHLEIACHFLWRSFDPRPEEIRKVRDIPVHCYKCGASGHYGPECALHRGQILSGRVTWSKANLLKYIDANSADRAISAGSDYSIPNPPRMDFSIKGKAHNPIVLDDSDEYEASLIRERVKRPRSRRGQIHFAPPSRPLPAPPDHVSTRRAPNPPRRARPIFAHVDSARYGREISFSPPPRHDDFRYDIREVDDRYRPQTPQVISSYRQAPQGSFPQRGQPSMTPGNNLRGGYSGTGGRNESAGASHTSSKQGRGKPRRSRIPKEDRARMAAEASARGN